ncbi:hypothetical protein V8E36_007564 [Tilletia maclaganii]
MISISSSTAALCPQSYASMEPCTECTHHVDPADPSSRPPQQPFPLAMPYMQHCKASTSRIITLEQAERLFPDDEAVHAAAAFWAHSTAFIDQGYALKRSDEEWSKGSMLDDDEVDDDSRSDLGAPEVDAQDWNAPPPAYEDVRKAERPSLSDISPVRSSALRPAPSTMSTAAPILRPVKPSRFTRALLGSTRAQAWAQQQAQRRAARWEECHDAWARLGIDTRAMLAEGGEAALPPFFEHPPRCNMDEMIAQMSL